MRRPALRALAAYDDDATPRGHPRSLRRRSTKRRGPTRSTPWRRAPPTRLALLDAVGQGTVPRRDLSATVARQLKALRDPRVDAGLERAWGTIRPTSKQKDALIARYKAILTPDRLQSADPAAGRLVFDRTCVQCHRLFDSGGDVGPELTGSDRANLDYILENVLDPGASVGRDYRLTTVATRDGRLISGIVREQTDDTLTIQTVNERIVLDRRIVEEAREIGRLDDARRAVRQALGRRGPRPRRLPRRPRAGAVAEGGRRRPQDRHRRPDLARPLTN